MTIRISPAVRRDPGHASVWLRCLAIDNVSESWHLDVIQAQFLDGEARAAREDFVRRHALGIEPVVSADDRGRVVMKAASVLIRHGRRPVVDPFWFPVEHEACERAWPE